MMHDLIADSQSQERHRITDLGHRSLHQTQGPEGPRAVSLSTTPGLVWVDMVQHAHTGCILVLLPRLPISIGWAT